MRLPALAWTAVTSIALALPCTAADSTPTKRDDSASEKLGIKLSLQCYTYRALSFFETVDKAATLGVKYLEIYPGQRLKPDSKLTLQREKMTDDTIAEIKKKLADAGGLKLVAYGVAKVPEKSEEEARPAFEWAKKMGIEVLVTETYPNEVHDKLCTEYGIKMALHNHPKTWPPDEVLKATKDRCKLIGSCADTGHWMRAGFIPVEALQKLDGRVLHSHFKDLNEYNMKAHDLPWGTGRGDAKGILTQLKKQGYRGYLSIEYEYGDVSHLDANLPKCVAFFDQTLTELAK
jgi:sugar phosphate isomerase/epimerase